MSNSSARVLGACAALVFAFGFGVYVGAAHGAAGGASDTGSSTLVLGFSSQPAADLSQFWKAWDLLQQNFVETHASSSIPTQQQKIYGAIAGLTDSYGDPYTVFFPPAQAQLFQQDISGAFGGVGMEMDQDKDNNLIVIAPLKDSPAQKAGIKTGDFILSINATSTQGMAVDEAVSLIRGPINTSVKLLVQHKGAAKPITITIVRQTIQIPEMNTYERSDGVYVIQLYTFSANSTDLFRDALRKFFESGSNKLIFDLRGNPGGYLDAAVQMASYFLPVGDTVVTEDFKGTQNNVVHRSLGYNVFAGRNLKMAILVDQGSASASEILAGALQQHGVAKLVGTRTFGKGSVQQLMDIGGGAQLKITIARWLTPNSTSISDGGLPADIKATRTDADAAAGKDPQMDAAAQYLNAQ